jgi:hypothetical protein
LVKASLVCTLLISVLLLSSLLFATPAFAQQDSALTAINSAQNNLINCYNAVRDAEAAGANVTSLTITLNSAANLLSQAQLAYASNDYGNAYNDATQSQTILNGFTSQVSNVKQTAENTQTLNSFTIILSIIISITILGAGISAYVLLSRRERSH